MSNQQVLALHSNHHLYYSIAQSNLEQAKHIERQLDENERQYLLLEAQEIEHYGRPDPDYLPLESARRMDLLRNQCQHTVQAVMFSAFTVESYINYYLIRKGSSNHFKQYLESLGPMQKWVIAPALFNEGRTLDPGKQPLQALGDLIRVRNNLVHAKPQGAVTMDHEGIHMSKSLENYYDPSIETASKCVETVSSLVFGLKDIDGQVDTDWLTDEIFSRVFYLSPEKI